MSLVSMLGKMALGAIAAKGVSSVMGGNSGGRGLAGGLGSLLGGGQQSGGLGALAGLLGGGSQQSGGGLGALAGLLGGSGSQQGGGLGALAGMLGGAQQSGGLGGLLDSLGGGQQAGGGLGGLLNSALQGETPQPTQSQEDQAELMLKAIISAAKADGQIDDAEQAKIAEHLGDITEDEVALVRREMAAPVDVQGLASSVPAGMEQQVYFMSLLAIDLDSKVEAQYLDQLARGMGLDHQTVNAIHDKLEAPKLYG